MVLAQVLRINCLDIALGGLRGFHLHRHYPVGTFGQVDYLFGCVQYFQAQWDRAVEEVTGKRLPYF